MTKGQIESVKHSWKIFRQIDPKLLGDIFYIKLFSLHPTLRKMFPDNMDSQHQKLIDMLSMIVGHLHKLEEVNHEIVEMGKRHVQYGVEPEHYKMVGDVLIWTLRKGLGKDWNDELEFAWRTCFEKLANGMMR